MNEMFKKLEWVGKADGYGNHKSKADISISVVNSKGKDAISFIFRNEIYVLLSEETDYIQFAIMKNRIFFQGATADNGLLMYSGSPRSTNKYMKLAKAEMVEKLRSFVGDYKLEYDEFYELYYIEK